MPYQGVLFLYFKATLSCTILLKLINIKNSVALSETSGSHLGHMFSLGSIFDVMVEVEINYTK